MAQKLLDAGDSVRVKPVTVDGTIGLSKSYPVEVKSAGDKGMGVFATRNIKRGEVCCYYDGLVTFGVAKGAMITGEQGYNQAFANDQVLAGFKQQFRVGGCAQMCNDASTTYTDDKDLKYLKNINVADQEIAGMGMAFVATKRIKKGEELLYSYGPQYWQIHNARAKKGESGDMQAKWDICMNELNDKVEPKLMEAFKLYDSSGTELTDYIARYMLAEMMCEAQHKAHI